MKDFAALFLALDGTTRTSAKVAALAGYFSIAAEADRLWTIALLSGRRPKRTVTATRLREWAAEAAGLPLWLFEESYSVVGDLAETIALVLPETSGGSDRSLTEWIVELKGLAALDESARRHWIIRAWQDLATGERFVFNKLLTGGFRMGVQPEADDAGPVGGDGHRRGGKLSRTGLDGRTGGPRRRAMTPSCSRRTDREPVAGPTPFSRLPAGHLSRCARGTRMATGRGSGSGDGIRGQLHPCANDSTISGSRGEELMTGPGFRISSDCATSGPTASCSTARCSRCATAAPCHSTPFRSASAGKTVAKKAARGGTAGMLAYDLLEENGEDLRHLPFAGRRARLEALLADLPVPTRPSSFADTSFDTWPVSLPRHAGPLATVLAEGFSSERLSSPLYGRAGGRAMVEVDIDP